MEGILDSSLARCLRTKQCLLLGSQMSWLACQHLKSVHSIIMFNLYPFLNDHTKIFALWRYLCNIKRRGGEQEKKSRKHVVLGL